MLYTDVSATFAAHSVMEGEQIVIYLFMIRWYMESYELRMIW